MIGVKYLEGYKVPPHIQEFRERVKICGTIQGRYEVCNYCIDHLVSVDCKSCIVEAPADVKALFLDPEVKLL